MTSSKKTVAPLIILALILAFICFLIWSALQAKNFGPRITDPDYYSKGLRYNTTLVEKRAASVLGWTISSSIRNGQLRVRLLDKQLRPVAKANGQLFLYQKKNINPEPASLEELEPGVYAAPLPVDQEGELRARVEFESAGARLNRDLLLNF